MRSSRQGIALILVLWVLAALIVLALGLGVTVRSEVQISRNYADLIRCRWAARAGINSAIGEIERLAKQPSVYLGELGRTLSSDELGIDLGGASFEVAIEDEAGKVNINAAPASVLEALFGDREIADCIRDWRDKDDIPRSLGAETKYYSRLRTPYLAKNAPFDTVGELSLVKGITSEILSGPADAGERSLNTFITVYSYSKNVAADGKKRIDIRTASKEQLKAELGDVLTDQDIEAIIKWRDGNAAAPAEPPEGERPSSGREEKLRSAGEIAAVPGLSREKARLIYDRITASDAKVQPGRININTAPAEALAAVPGLDSRLAEEIVTYREANGPFEDVGQLLEVSDLNADAFAKAADLLTVRSGVFKIVSTGRLAGQQSSGVITCVVDATDGKAKIRYWQE
ncbi:MAG TPA: helix-hairpin-helix domain-containing protein [Armatimonadota bacterium]|nr:helix-hairpin-helix domain-containing protein [Armatimonadota bacterium]